MPFVVVGPAVDEIATRDGRLADVAPTLLALLGLAQSSEMTGASLLVPAPSAAVAAGQGG